jgi:hypothetical protein
VAASSSDSGATRTLDPQLRRLLLYPTELRNQYFNLFLKSTGLATLARPIPRTRDCSILPIFNREPPNLIRVQKYIIFQFLQPEIQSLCSNMLIHCLSGTFHEVNKTFLFYYQLKLFRERLKPEYFIIY